MARLEEGGLMVISSDGLEMNTSEMAGIQRHQRRRGCEQILETMENQGFEIYTKRTYIYPWSDQTRGQHVDCIEIVDL